MIYIPNRVHQLYQGNMFTDIIKNAKIPLYLQFLDLLMKRLFTLLLCLVTNACVINTIISEYPFDWHTNDSFIWPEISSGVTISLDVNNAEAKVLKQKWFEFFFLYIFQCWCRSMKLGLDHWFWISNGNSKYWNFWPSLAFNIALENVIVKFRLPCTEVCVQPLSINIKPMFLPS